MKSKMKGTTVYLVRGACIAALYATVTALLKEVSFGVIQFRVSEALTLLPYIMPEAVWGLTIGCFIANIFGGSVIDMIFGTLATLIAAFLTSKIRSLWLSPLPPIIINGLVVGAVVTVITYEFTFITYLTVALSIALSEAIICYCGGIPLLVLLNKTGILNNRHNE